MILEKTDALRNLLIRVLLFCISCAVTLAITSGVTAGVSGGWGPVFSFILAISITLVLSAAFVRWEGIQLKDIGVLPGPKTIGLFLSGLLIGLVLATSQVFLVLLLGPLTLVRSTTISIWEIIQNLFLYFLIACREELAFRGYPLRSLNRVINPWPSILIVACLFAIEHRVGGITWGQALMGPAVGGILFGLAAIKSRGLAMPIGLHFAWNLIQWALGFKNGNAVFRIVAEKGNDKRIEFIGWISYLLVMGIAILVFSFRMRKRATQQNE